MHCSKAAQNLQLYIDKQLTLSQIRELEAHLSTCNSCQDELFLLEEIDGAFRDFPAVAEPADLTRNIMSRVAFTAQLEKESSYELLRPSFSELLVVVLLATFTTIGIIWQQPALRGILPFANGHDLLYWLFANASHILMGVNSDTLLLVCWVLGTVIGIWITLALAGAEMRSSWYKAMIDRLPVR